MKIFHFFRTNQGDFAGGVFKKDISLGSVRFDLEIVVARKSFDVRTSVSEKFSPKVVFLRRKTQNR